MNETRLSEKRVIITRSKEGNVELASRLTRMGFTPIIVDTTEYLPPRDWKEVDVRLSDLQSYDWIVFTSSTGVRFFVERMRELGLAARWSGKPLVSAVGEKTAKALNFAGLHVSFIPSKFLTSALGDELPSGEGSKVLLLRANIAEPELANRLVRRRFEVDDTAIYRTNYLEADLDAKNFIPVDLVIFGSPSAVKGFCDRIPSHVLDRVRRAKAACIGPVTADAARQAGFKSLMIPKEHTYDALLEEIGRSR
jgi:uroporphyrinogen-III synthase